MADEKPELGVEDYFYHAPDMAGAEAEPQSSMNPLEVEQVKHELEEIVHEQLDDPNMDNNLVHDAEQALETGDAKAEVTLGHLIEEDSPYIEVRAAVSNVDDPTMPVNTFRAWFLGTIVSIVVPGLNQFLYFRYPTTGVGAYCVIVVVYPMGKFLAWALPRHQFKTPLGSFSLNPGPFNVKEHTLISLMTMMSASSAYGAQIPAVQKVTYNLPDYGYGYGILIILSTQLVGLSFANLTRRFLVWPSSMIWPSKLPTCTLLNSLHSVKTTGGITYTGMSRYKFFWITAGIFFMYQFFPTYIFTMLSIGNWFCLIAPDNVILNQVLGTQSGLGLLPFTFDWTVISYAIDPLATPWWSLVNSFVGFVIFFVIACPLVYYCTGSWYGKYLPMFSTATYDRFGQIYEVHQVVDQLPGGGLVFNAEKYNDYSLLYVPSALAISYMLSFASVTSVFVHAALFNGKSLWRQFRSDPAAYADIHNRLMSNYKETPYLWYLILFLGSFAMGVGGACLSGSTPWMAFRTFNMQDEGLNESPITLWFPT